MKNEEQTFCTKCSSALVLVTKTIRPSANPLYPITVTKYRCTNDACQADTDKKVADAAQQRAEREERTRIRLQAQAQSQVQPQVAPKA